MRQALCGAFSGDQHEWDNHKPMGREAKEELATGLSGS
jgi:hypothetical protein